MDQGWQEETGDPRSKEDAERVKALHAKRYPNGCPSHCEECHERLVLGPAHEGDDREALRTWWYSWQPLAYRAGDPKRTDAQRLASIAGAAGEHSRRYPDGVVNRLADERGAGWVLRTLADIIESEARS